MTQEMQLRLWDAPRVGGLTTDPDEAALGEAFLYEAGPGAWLVGHWSLIPKLEYNGWWFAHWWHGPGSRHWTATHNGHAPEEVARFPSAEAAAETLAGENP